MLDLSPLQLHKFRVFSLTFLTYAILTAARVPFPISKSSLHPDSTKGYEPFDNDNGAYYLGLLDSVFLSSYSIGLFLSGYLGDRLNLKYFSSIGLLLSGLFCVGFGMAKILNIHLIGYFIVIQIGAGFSQSTGWPTIVSIISKWFNHSRGSIMGFWNASSPIGNVLGKLLATSVLTIGWQYAFLSIGSICVLFSLIVYICLVPDPRTVLNDEELRILSLTTHDILPRQESEPGMRHEPISFLRAVRIPGVIPYSVALFFSKLTVYSFISWLPFYLSEELHYTKSVAGTSSILFDIGGVLGGIVAGYASDKTGKSGCVSFLMLISCIPTIFFYQVVAPWGVFANCAFMFLIGLIVSAPYTLICSAVSADLGTHPSLNGNPHAVSTVSGIVDGTGSIGSAIQGILIGWLSSSFGWNGVFWLLMTCSALSAFCIIGVVKHELFDQKKLHQNGTLDGEPDDSKLLNIYVTRTKDAKTVSDDDEQFSLNRQSSNTQQQSNQTNNSNSVQLVIEENDCRSPLLAEQK